MGAAKVQTSGTHFLGCDGCVSSNGALLVLRGFGYFLFWACVMDNARCMVGSIPFWPNTGVRECRALKAQMCRILCGSETGKVVPFVAVAACVTS